MKSSTKILLLGVILVAAVGATISPFVPYRQPTIVHTSYTTNTGELTRDVLVGQTFKSEHANLSGVAVMFATYSNRGNTAPIRFHLRESYESSLDVRTAQVTAEALHDNQLYQFEFEPIADSKDKTYFFFVVSPDSTPGNAVTVDLDTRNPYHLGTAFVVRGQGSTITDPVILARSGKPTQDVGFATWHTLSARTALISHARLTVHRLIVTWDDARSSYLNVARAAIPALAFIVFLLSVSAVAKKNPARLSRPATVFLTLLALLLFGLGWRFLYAVELPLTDDEGNYLYDARSLRQGLLAGGDGYVKAPLVVAWVAIWQAAAGTTVMAGRLSSIIIGSLTIFPVYVLGRQLKDHATGLLAAATWALFGASVLAHIYVHTQPVALFFGLSGLAVIWSALGRYVTHQEPSPFHQATLPAWKLVFGGMLLALGVASRKSILALGVLPLLFVITHQPTWLKRFRALVAIGSGFMLVLVVFLGSAYWLYGPVGVYEALGLASAEDGQATPEPSEIAKIRSYSLRGMTPFFRESLPLILLALLGWGWLLEAWLRSQLRSAFTQKPNRRILFIVDQVGPKVLWLLPLIAFWWCFNFFFEYEGEAFMFWGIPSLWYAMGGVIILAMLWPRAPHEAFVFDERLIKTSTQPLPPNVVSGVRHRRLLPARLVPSGGTALASVVFLPAWLGALAFFYLNWIKFHANYISEFLPPLVLLAGVGAVAAWQRFSTAYWVDTDHPFREILRKVLAATFMAVLLWSMVVSNFITYLYEHTGTLQQPAAQEAAAWARANIPLDQPIFTGAVLIPYLSGHHTALNIAHPRWYAYEFTRTDPRRLNTFLPPVEKMVQAWRDSDWFLLDKQTSFSFLMEYGEIERGLAQDFTRVVGIANGSNTLTFYRRTKAQP